MLALRQVTHQGTGLLTFHFFNKWFIFLFVLSYWSTITFCFIFREWYEEMCILCLSAYLLGDLLGNEFAFDVLMFGWFVFNFCYCYFDFFFKGGKLVWLVSNKPATCLAVCVIQLLEWKIPVACPEERRPELFRR